MSVFFLSRHYSQIMMHEPYMIHMHVVHSKEYRVLDSRANIKKYHLVYYQINNLKRFNEYYMHFAPICDKQENN